MENFDSYFWFFYIGIFLFVTQILLQGLSPDLSFFGLLLIYLGWYKVEIWSWLFVILWIFIVIEVLATIFRMQQKVGQYLDPSGELTREEFDDLNDDNENDEAKDEEDDTKDEEDEAKDEEQKKGEE